MRIYLWCQLFIVDIQQFIWCWFWILDGVIYLHHYFWLDSHVGDTFLNLFLLSFDLLYLDERRRVNLFISHFLLLLWTALFRLVILIAHKPLIIPFEYLCIRSLDNYKILLFRKIDSFSNQFLVLFLEVTISSTVIIFCGVPLGHWFYQFQSQLYQISSLVHSILSDRSSHHLLEVGIGSGLNILLISLELAHIDDLLMNCLRKNLLNANVVHNPTQQ